MTTPTAFFTVPARQENTNRRYSASVLPVELYWQNEYPNSANKRGVEG